MGVRKSALNSDEILHTVNSRSKDSAYNKDLTSQHFYATLLGCFSLFLYHGYINISLQH